MNLRSVHGAESVSIASARATAEITLTGAHIAPVTFVLGDREVQPYSLPPWQPQDFPDAEPILSHLRGDFFCMPFGETAAGPIHGEVANNRWQVDRHGPSSVTLSMRASDLDADIHKTVSVNDDDAVLYQQVRSNGLQGRWNYGTHPVLDLSALPPGSGRLSTSPLRYCSVHPTLFSLPERGETQVLQPGAEFTDLAAVPRMDGSTLDLTHYPTEPGHEDLVMLVNDPEAGDLGWSAMVLDGYVWIALKSVRTLPMTLLWITNGGRTADPWQGRHVGRMGIEDVCSYFAIGPEASLDNPLVDRGIATFQTFDDEHQLDLRTAHLVAPVGPDFDAVSHVTTTGHGTVRIDAVSGASVTASVDWGFVLG
jgi:hypothetical protein